MDDHEEKLTKLLNLYVELVHNKFNKYAFYFFFCEFLNIIVTVFMVSVIIISVIYLIVTCSRFWPPMCSSTINTLTMVSTSTSTTGGPGHVRLTS